MCVINLFALKAHSELRYSNMVSWTNYLISSWWVSALTNFGELALYNFIKSNSLIIGWSLVLIHSIFVSFSSLWITPRQSLAIAYSSLAGSSLFKLFFILCSSPRYPYVYVAHADLKSGGVEDTQSPVPSNARSTTKSHEAAIWQGLFGKHEPFTTIEQHLDLR